MLNVYTNTTDFKITEPTVVAIGKFDGDHIGHQKIFEIMRKIKAEKGYKSAVFTFLEMPDKQISPGTEKHSLFESEGIDYCIEYPFNEKTRAITANDFLDNILVNKLNMRHIVAGTDCAFGHNREGDKEFLLKYSSDHDYCVTIIDKVKIGETDISSTYIRHLLDSGRVEDVAELLCHPYRITGKVEEGNHLGSTTLGYPTANIYPDSDKYIPASGVYAVKVNVENDSDYFGMTNIGTNPSIKDDDFNHCKRIETYIFGFNHDIYGKIITISFIKYIRPEVAFDSITDLKEQLINDELQIRALFK